jgi:hypothetical protein
LDDIQDVLNDCIGGSRHLVVPDPNDAPAIAFEPGCAPLIGFAVRVLAAVDFDDEAVSYRNEVRDVRSDRALAAEFISRQPAISQDQPQPMLGVGGFTAQFPSGFAGH